MNYLNKEDLKDQGKTTLFLPLAVQANAATGHLHSWVQCNCSAQEKLDAKKNGKENLHYLEKELDHLKWKLKYEEDSMKMGSPVFGDQDINTLKEEIKVLEKSLENWRKEKSLGGKIKEFSANKKG
eukprot:88835_1